MAQFGSTLLMGTTADQTSPPRPIQIDVGRLMERVRSSSESIVKVVALMEDPLARAHPDATTEWNLMAAPMLQGFQQDLLNTQHQMAIYAEAMNPDSVEFHTAQANVAHAITMAEIYLTLYGSPSNPHRTPSSHSQLPATILTPATTPSGLPNTTRHVSLATNTGETISLEVTTVDDTTMQVEPSPNANTDTIQPDTVTNDVPYLEITIGEEEMAQLYQEAMDEPPETLSTENNPRDGLQPPASKPTLPELEPGGTEVTVETSMEHDSNTEEIVDNKTVRIDKEVQPTDTLDDLFTCRGCKATGHVL